MNEIKEKKQYRAWAKEIRANLGQGGLQKISMDIEQKLRELPEFKKANQIMTYLAKEIEVSLNGLFDVMEKKWFLPKVNSDNESFSLLIVPYETGKTELVKGAFDILEPKIIEENFYNQKNKKINLDLIFVPGLCFDKNGNRIGFGKGFYDRFLKLNPNSFKVGCCPKECYVDTLPSDLWDEKVDLVITDS